MLHVSFLEVVANAICFYRECGFILVFAKWESPPKKQEVFSLQ